MKKINNMKIWKDWQLKVSTDEKNENLKKLTVKGKTRFWQFAS